MEDIMSRYKFDKREARLLEVQCPFLGGKDDATERILPQGRKMV